MVFLAVTTTALAQGDRPPKDFVLVAEFEQGYGPWSPWKVTVGGDGNAIQEVRSSTPPRETLESKRLTLTRYALSQLLAKVEDARFFTLAKSYSYAVTDSPTLVLRVTMNGKSHEVSVYAPGDQKDKEEVRRFLGIWNEVLRRIPSPNADQKPD